MPAEDTVDKIDHVADRAAEAAEEITDAAAVVAEKTKETAGNFTTALEWSVHERPIATLFGTLAVAFVVGALWKV